MKQYLNSDQTAKLIELGFENPKNERWVLDVANESTPSIQNIVKRQDYSIGELIEMLENAVQKDNFITDLDISCDEIAWLVRYISEGVGRFKTQMPDLIDALYLMLVKLKEEGVI